MFPVDPKPSAPDVAFLMAEAASKADVGPLAAVAGALVDVAVKDVDASYILFENGGEVYARVDRPAIIGIHAGSSPFSGKILLSVNEGECPIGVGTSSASVGHAVTFGEADAATAVADNTALADAAATAICNKVEGSTIEYSLRKGVDAAKKIRDVRGTLIIRGHHMIAWGRLPRLSMDKPQEIT